MIPGRGKEYMESILQGTKECYLCRLRMNEKEDFRRLPSIGLEEHHIMHGTANRKQSEKYGLKVWLCCEDHRTGKEAVHRCREIDLKLICIAQRKFEELYGHDKWMEVFMKNYI